MYTPWLISSLASLSNNQPEVSVIIINQTEKYKAQQRLTPEQLGTRYIQDPVANKEELRPALRQNFNCKDLVLVSEGSDLLTAIASYLWETSFSCRGPRIHKLSFCSRCHAFVDRNSLHRGNHDKSEVLLFKDLDKSFKLESAVAVRRTLIELSSQTGMHEDGLVAIPSMNPIANYRYCIVFSLRP